MFQHYLTLNLIILSIPLALSFKWYFRYFDNVKYILTSIAIVGGAYIAWDAIVTYIGHWWFNKDYLIGLNILGLPIEEILFFVTVPYSCIFIYENLKFFIPEKQFSIDEKIIYGAGAIFMIAGLISGIFYGFHYTMLAFFSCGIFMFLAGKYFMALINSSHYWIFIAGCFVPFLIFNYLLTSIPIVLYNPDTMIGTHADWDGRFITIPLEDFFYNFSMLSFYLVVYIESKKWFPKNNDGKVQEEKK